MAAEPLNRLSLRATSLADDLGFVALADLGRALESDDEVPYRVIGGQMVMALAAPWSLGADLYRVTLDADLGTPPVVVRDHTFLERLAELGYKQVAGDRFARSVDDIPDGDETDTRARQLKEHPDCIQCGHRMQDARRKAGVVSGR